MNHTCTDCTGLHLFLTEPVFAISNTESVLVLNPGPVEVYTAVHPPLEDLGKTRDSVQEVNTLFNM